jgi:hypothetical protein
MIFKYDTANFCDASVIIMPIIIHFLLDNRAVRTLQITERKKQETGENSIVLAKYY